MSKFQEILWEDLEVGDTFPDGSTVTQIRPWTREECYVVSAAGQEIIVSFSHLLKSKILDKNMKSAEHILDFPLSNKIREDLMIRDNEWFSAKDLYTIQNIDEYKAYLSSGSDLVEIDSIERYMDGKPQRVRCISTTTGQYQIGVFTNHNTGGKDLGSARKRDVIFNTLDAYGTSYIVKEAAKAKTTEEAREIMYERLKEEYKDNGIKMDDFNIAMVAKKLTSYKRDKNGTRLVREGEKCDIVSMLSIGNSSNPFKSAELQSSYRKFTTPEEYEIKKDAANEIIF